MAQQTSIHILPVKGGSEQHNKREKELDYIRPELSHLNEYWEEETQMKRLEKIKSKYLSTTGQKMQAKATPIREGVVVIQHSTTKQDLQRLAKVYEERFGIKVFQIALHKDEGYHKAKEWQPNLHAHLVFDWTDKSGKSIKLNRSDMVEMQTITAEVLGMERGVASDKNHLSALQYKNQKEEERIAELKAEEESIKVSKAHKEAVIEIAKSASEGVKSLLGISSREKELKVLKTQINALKEELQEVQKDADKVLQQNLSILKQEITAKDRICQELNDKLNREVENTRIAVKEKTRLEQEKERISEILGDKFRTLYEDVKKYFKGFANNFSMSVTMWCGAIYNNNKQGIEREEYIADKTTGKLLINGKTIEEKLTQKKEQQREEPKIKPVRGKGFRL